jgi:long-chain fatty acid transport protein
MIYFKNWFPAASVVVTLIFLQSPLPVYGSGYGIFTQGADALGQGNAVIAHGDGPSAAYFNPALITKLPGTQIEVGTTLIFPNREYYDPYGSKYTTQEDILLPPSTFYITHAFTDKLSASMAVFDPFGLSTDWGENWPGRYITTKAEMLTVNFNPAVAYRILPNLSVAAGLDVVYLDSTLKSAVPSSSLGIPGPNFDVMQKFSGTGTGVGFNLGLAYDINKALSVGVAYRSKVDISVDGDYHNALMPYSVSADADITLPQQLTAGIAYRPIDPLVLELGIRWEDWSSTNNLTVKIPALATASVYPRDWHGTAAITAGGKYRINDMFSASLGYLYGWNPVPDNTFEPAIPDSNSHLFCIGGEARVKNFTFDLAYALQLLDDRTKGFNKYGPIAMGEYKSYLNMLALSIGYKF